MRECFQCKMKYPENAFYSKSHSYCSLCNKYNNMTKYKKTREAYNLKHKARESAQKAEYYQRKKKERGDPIVYRTPRVPVIHTEPEKPIVWDISFN